MSEKTASVQGIEKAFHLLHEFPEITHRRAELAEKIALLVDEEYFEFKKLLTFSLEKFHEKR